MRFVEERDGVTNDGVARERSWVNVGTWSQAGDPTGSDVCEGRQCGFPTSGRGATVLVEGGPIDERMEGVGREGV